MNESISDTINPRAKLEEYGYILDKEFECGCVMYYFFWKITGKKEFERIFCKDHEFVMGYF